MRYIEFFPFCISLKDAAIQVHTEGLVAAEKKFF